MFVDGATGGVLSTERTSSAAEGGVYPTSPALSEVEVVTLLNLVSERVLDGTLAVARSCDGPELGETSLEGSLCTLSTPHALADAAGDLFEPNPGSVLDPFAEVRAYHHFDRVSTWMIDRSDCSFRTLRCVPW